MRIVKIVLGFAALVLGALGILLPFIPGSLFLFIGASIITSETVVGRLLKKNFIEKFPRLWALWLLWRNRARSLWRKCRLRRG